MLYLFCVVGCIEGEIRLVEDGNVSLSQGHIEICQENIWNTVCSNEWDLNEATVVCRQLGLSSAGKYS